MCTFWAILGELIAAIEEYISGDDSVKEKLKIKYGTRRILNLIEAEIFSSKGIKYLVLLCLDKVIC